MNISALSGYSQAVSSTQERPDTCPRTDRPKPPASIGATAAHAADSSVKVVLSAAATEFMSGAAIGTGAMAKLGVGQFASAAIRSKINEATDNSVVRCLSHAGVQAARNACRGTSVVTGAMGGLGYCAASEAADFLTESGHPGAALVTKIAGAYAIEMAVSYADCRLTLLAGQNLIPFDGPLRGLGRRAADAMACGAYMAKGFVSATFISMFSLQQSHLAESDENRSRAAG